MHCTGAKSARFSHSSVYSVQPKAPGGQTGGNPLLEDFAARDFSAESDMTASIRRFALVAVKI